MERSFPGGSEVKSSASNARDLGSIPGSGIPWRRKWQPTPVRGWRSLVGYSPQGHKESDMTEQLHFTSLDQGSPRIINFYIFLALVRSATKIMFTF